VQFSCLQPSLSNAAFNDLHLDYCTVREVNSVATVFPTATQNFSGVGEFDSEKFTGGCHRVRDVAARGLYNYCHLLSLSNVGGHHCPPNTANIARLDQRVKHFFGPCALFCRPRSARTSSTHESCTRAGGTSRAPRVFASAASWVAICKRGARGALSGRLRGRIQLEGGFPADVVEHAVTR
jgi:hypothetical protein